MSFPLWSLIHSLLDPSCSLSYLSILIALTCYITQRVFDDVLLCVMIICAYISPNKDDGDRSWLPAIGHYHCELNITSSRLQMRKLRLKKSKSKVGCGHADEYDKVGIQNQV